jgi:hypothetical protein
LRIPFDALLIAIVAVFLGLMLRTLIAKRAANN